MKPRNPMIVQLVKRKQGKHNQKYVKVKGGKDLPKNDKSIPILRYM